MKTGNGKIANLPSAIRDELNWRINDGDEGKELVDWLNAKPEVVKVVTRLFDGKPISQQNLSLWRTHGYLRWHAYHIIMRETADLAGNSGDIQATGIDCEKMMWALKANYADMIQRWLVTPTDQMSYRLKVFKHLTAAVVSIDGAEIRRERLELLREKKANKSASSGKPAASRSPETARAKSPVPSKATRAGKPESPHIIASAPGPSDRSSDFPTSRDNTHIHASPPERPNRDENVSPPASPREAFPAGHSEPTQTGPAVPPAPKAPSAPIPAPTTPPTPERKPRIRDRLFPKPRNPISEILSAHFDSE